MAGYLPERTLTTFQRLGLRRRGHDQARRIPSRLGDAAARL